MNSSDCDGIEYRVTYPLNGYCVSPQLIMSSVIFISIVNRIRHVKRVRCLPSSPFTWPKLICFAQYQFEESFSFPLFNVGARCCHLEPAPKKLTIVLLLVKYPSTRNLFPTTFDKVGNSSFPSSKSRLTHEFSESDSVASNFLFLLTSIMAATAAIQCVPIQTGCNTNDSMRFSLCVQKKHATASIFWSKIDT